MKPSCTRAADRSSPSPRSSWTVAAPLVVLTAAACLVACGDPGSTAPSAGDLPPLEIEEVGVALDAELSLEEDEQGRRRTTPQLSGVLPESFPADLPLPDSITVVDMDGSGGSGARFVELFTAQRREQVRQVWLQRLRAAGWSVPALPGVASHSGRRVTISLGEDRSGTSIRMEY